MHGTTLFVCFGFGFVRVARGGCPFDGRTGTCRRCNGDGRDNDTSAAQETKILGSLSVDTVSACFAFKDVIYGLFGMKMAGAGSKLVGLFGLLVEENLC